MVSRNQINTLINPHYFKLCR